MDFEQIVFEELNTDTEEIIDLNEGTVPLNATLAFFTLKKNALQKLLDLKSTALIKKEQLHATLGINQRNREGTAYKLTQQQISVLQNIRKKYGQEILDDVFQFRKSILAPYQLIKRITKNNKTITSQEKFGMTHFQFKNALETGLRKIEKRKNFEEKDKEIKEAIDNLTTSIESLKQLKRDFSTSGELKDSIVNKVLKTYNLGPEEFSSSYEDLRKTYDELTSNLKKIRKDTDNEKEIELQQDLVKRNIELRKGIVKKENKEKEDGTTKEKDLTDEPEFNSKGGFNAELAKYMLKRNIINELKNKSENIYKKTYSSIIDEMIKKAIERKIELSTSRMKGITGIEFNNIERKIFVIKSNAGVKYSGNLSDYFIMVKDEDFKDVEYLKKPQAVEEAERKIEAEIKRFERALQKKISEEDMRELKRYRLINNLITVRELENPDKLFKSTEEIKKEVKDSSSEKEE